jgi:hypothetical protein
LAHRADPNGYDAPKDFAPLHYTGGIETADIAAALLKKNAGPLAAGPKGNNRSPLFVSSFAKLSRRAQDIPQSKFEVIGRFEDGGWDESITFSCPVQFFQAS